jgi:rhamnose utilization protein RhaD (predicted bifunctional aldolase and dehydrogenase)
MESKLKDLVEISGFFGRNPEFVIAGGGNTSFKNRDFIWIKASGTSLSTINEEGFVKLDRHALSEISKKSYSSDPIKRESEIITELFSCIAEDSLKRPSVETSLHNLLQGSFVVHTHPTLVNGLMCSQNALKECRSLFGDDPLVIEYTDPGYVLFKLVEQRIEEYQRLKNREPEIIFLQNHGVFVSSDNIEEIKVIYSYIINRITDQLRHRLPSTITRQFDPVELIQKLSVEKKLHAAGYLNDLISEFVKNAEAFQSVSTAFTPDNIVYCKAHYLFSKPDINILLDDYSEFQRKFGYSPKVIGIENCGIICLEESRSSVETVYEIFLDMMKISFYARNFGGPIFMTSEQIEFIDTWEVEHYRRKVAKQL